MAPCLEGLLNTTPLAKAPQRKNQGEISVWDHPGLQHRELIVKLTLTCPWRLPPPCVPWVCSVCILHDGIGRMSVLVCVCAKKVLAKSTAAFIVTHGSIPSDLSIQKMKNPLFFYSDTTPLLPLSFFQFSPLFFYSIISSSHAVWMFSPDSHGRTEPGAPALLLECH